MEQADFLPESIRLQRARRKRLARQGYLLAACLACLVLLSYVRHGRVAQARADLAELDACVASQQRMIAQIPPLERQMANLLIKKQIDSELGSRTDCTAVLAELCRLMPTNMSMISLKLETVEIRIRPDRGSLLESRRAVRSGGKQKTDKLLRRVQVVITGLAPTDVDVANFIGQLSASPLFEDVNMGYAKTRSFRGRSAREFQASCYLVR